MKVELVWVDALLCRWGRWALRCESGALGFATSSILACSGEHDNVDGYSHSTLPRGLIDEDMELIDGAIRNLPKVLRIVVIEVYQWGQGKSDRRLAMNLGISRQALCEYTNQAHRKISLDISFVACQNRTQSANWGNSLRRNKQPVVV